MKKILLSCLLIAWFAINSNAQAVVPRTDNPFRTKYNSELNGQIHWTDSIKWNNVYDITQESGSNWMVKYISARDKAVAAGGGVVYFPYLGLNGVGNDSSYNFTENLELKSGVVLRGEKSVQYDAKSKDFYPKSYISFPKYMSLLANANAGFGTKNTTAFKLIVAGDMNLKNSGLVDLDINRAGVLIMPQFAAKPGFSTPQPTSNMSNIIVMGIRNNNVAFPSQDVPNVTLGQERWQRWGYRFMSNINLFVSKNAIVCNNRINDLENNNYREIITDNFPQAGYIAQGSATALSGPQAEFSYTAHPAISINKIKFIKFKLLDYLDSISVAGFVSAGTLQNEPSLFPTNLEIRDNWLFKTERAGIIFSGMNVKCLNNQITDQKNKVRYLDPVGSKAAKTTAPASTYENQGIDFSGVNVEIKYNNIEFYRYNIANLPIPLYSADGSGFYGQANGSALPNNIDIQFNECITDTTIAPDPNKVNGYSAASSDLYNITISNNNSRGYPIVLDAFNSSNNYKLVNCKMENNIRVTGITMRSKIKGSGNFCLNNKGTGNILKSCDVCTNNASGFDCIYDNNNQQTFANPSTPFTNDVDCIADPSPVTINIINPTKDTFLLNGTINTFNIKAQLSSTVFSRVIFYDGMGNLIDSVVNTGTISNKSISIPANFVGIYSVYCVVKVGNNVVGYSKPINIEVNSAPRNPPLSLAKVENLNKDLTVFPNPTNGDLNISLANASGQYSVSLVNLVGQVVLEKSTSDISSLSLDISFLSKGVYLLKVSNGLKVGMKKIVKK